VNDEDDEEEERIVFSVPAPIELDLGAFFEP
jgi:hypothetical protein